MLKSEKGRGWDGIHLKAWHRGSTGGRRMSLESALALPARAGINRVSGHLK